MQMRKITALLLAWFMSLSLAACGSSQNTAADTSSGSQESQIASGNSQKTEAAVESSSMESSEDSEIQSGSDTNTSDNAQTTEEAKKILVLYFSANNTKDVDAVSSATPMADGVSSVEWIANIIHDNVGGDLVPIIPAEDYPLEYNDLADYAKQEKEDKGRPAFEDLGVDPTSYETVFIGYPIWWYEMPMIMDTFFETYDFSGVTIIPFNTHAGSRDGGTYGDIRELEPNATVLDGLAVRGEDVGKDSAKTSVEEWLTGLKLD